MIIKKDYEYSQQLEHICQLMDHTKLKVYINDTDNAAGSHSPYNPSFNNLALCAGRCNDQYL